MEGMIRIMICVAESELKIVQDILKKYVPDCEVRVFGSRYKWTAKDYSDLDLAIVGNGSLDKKLFYDMKDAFEESDLPFRVDLLDWNGISREFQEVIERGYEVVQEVGSGKLKMESGWREVLLESVADLTVGFVGSMSDEYIESGVPFLRSLNIEPFKIKYDGMKYISQNFHDRLQKSKLSPGDVVVVRTGKPGACTVIPDALVEANCSDLVIIRPHRQMLDSYFLAAYINSVASHHVNAHLVGAVQQHFNIGSAKKIKMFLPSLYEQKTIAAILCALDDKIEVNIRINKTLEEMAQAIFKSWFVDFEPFQDGEFEDSELGRIPKGWRVVELGECVNSIDNRGKTPPLAIGITDYPIIDVKALSGQSRIINYENCTKYVDANTYTHWFRSGHPKPLDILISTVGSLAEMKLFYGEVGCVAQNVVGLRSKNISALYLYQYLQYIKSDLISYNIGSVQPSIKVTQIIKHKILIPDGNALEAFDSIMSKILELVFQNFRQTQNLTTIRDSLLPKLMSGEIRVPIQEVV